MSQETKTVLSALAYLIDKQDLTQDQILRIIAKQLKP